MDSPWSRPGQRTAALIRDAAELILASSAAMVDRVVAAAHQDTGLRALVEDPLLAAADRRMIKVYLLHWLGANVQDPGAPVERCLDPEFLPFVRDLVRRGMDLHDLGLWRGAQHAMWEMWVDACFTATTDVDQLRDLMKVSERSITTFIDDSIAALDEYIDQECADLVGSVNADRHATAQLILEGAPIGRARAESRLGYPLTGSHLGVIIWSGSAVDAAGLDAAAEAVMQVCGARRGRLTLNASASALWVWVPVDSVPSIEAAEGALSGCPGIHVAFGRPGRDLEGFRRSHLDAAAAQRLLLRVGSARPVVRYEDVALVSVLTADMAQADQFVTETLGDLATADPALRDTVLTYVRERFNGSAAAERLFTHRNTVERRLAKADQLLPVPLAENTASVLAALMLVQLRD